MYANYVLSDNIIIEL